MLALCDLAFLPVISHLDLGVCEASADVTFFVDPDLTIRAANGAYVQFGETNGLVDIARSFGVGCSIVDVISLPLRDYYATAYEQTLRSRKVFHHDYECSSPDRYRWFRLSTYPLPGSTGLMVTHHKLYETRHPEPGTAYGPEHLSPDGFVVQCAHCRKVRNWRATGSWDWIPALVERPFARTSHGLCEPCLDHYYPA